MAARKCAWCRGPVRQPVGAINRAIRIGAPIYCGRVCAGYGRRKFQSAQEKQEQKRLYDLEYRKLNAAVLKAKKAVGFQNRSKRRRAYERRYRAEHMDRHVEYCRRPDQVEKRKERDAARYAAEFGEYAESHRLLMELLGEINARSTRYEIYQANGIAAKATERKREFEKAVGRYTQRSPVGDLTRYQAGRHAAGAG